MGRMKAIEARGLSKRYGRVLALKNVSFEVEKGEVIGLLGPNGAGKTTLMKLLTGYLQPDEGHATIAGADVVEDPIAVQQRIGYLPENAPVYNEMAVQEYLVMMAALRSIPDGKRHRMLADAVEATGLGDYLTRQIGELSKGYRQRVGIAQAILHRPELLILDEPTTGLDPNQIIEIRELIERLSENSTVVLSTHILPEVEMTCERVLVIMNGELEADASLEKLRAEHTSNAAIVAIEESASGVREALLEVDGVKEVAVDDEPADHEDGEDGEENVYRGRLIQGVKYRRWRVTGRTNEPLCPAIFDAIRNRGWKVAEIRPDERSLEQVFRELAGSKEASL